MLITYNVVTTKMGVLAAILMLVMAVVAEDLTSIESCPRQLTNSEIAYTPFKAWFNYYQGSSQQCWNWASCIFLAADESRKQQFAATALVMGLIPLTFKDIAWPGRRETLLTRKLPWYLDVLVRALGLEPLSMSEPTDDDRARIKAWWMTSWLAGHVWQFPLLAIAISSFSLICAGGVLLLAEIYSKRSALGCVYAGFAVTWYVVALVPATVHTTFRTLREKHEAKQAKSMFNSSRGGLTAVQGGEEWWVVQLGWAVYYIAGTLVYTSIMAVTIIELVVWVFASAAMTAACKMLGYFICMLLEKQSRPKWERESVNTVSVVNGQKRFNEAEGHELLAR